MCLHVKDFFECDAIYLFFFGNKKCSNEEEYIDIQSVKIDVCKYVNVGSEKLETNAMLKCVM